MPPVPAVPPVPHNGWNLRTVRADSGFFENALLTFLEALGIPYIVAARRPRRRKATRLATWTPIDATHAWARFSLKLQGWAKPCEFYAIRELVREIKNAGGRHWHQKRCPLLGGGRKTTIQVGGIWMGNQARMNTKLILVSLLPKALISSTLCRNRNVFAPKPRIKPAKYLNYSATSPHGIQNQCTTPGFRV